MAATATKRRYSASEISVDGDTANVHLVDGPVAVIDSADVEIVQGIRWRSFHPPSSKTPYATGYIPGRKAPVYMHRLIMGVVNSGRKTECDHRNHNGLDNRRSNLRVCTHSQNSANRRRVEGAATPYRGIAWRPKRNKWVAIVNDPSGGRIEAGAFTDPIEAAMAFDRKAREVYGEFATLNFPQEVEFNG
jgi:hypothetical protein